MPGQPTSEFDIETYLDTLFRAAATTAIEDLPANGFAPIVRPSKHSDYQANGVLPLAKALGKPPRPLAQAIVDALPRDAGLGKVEIAGPGFINIQLDDAFVGQLGTRLGESADLGLSAAAKPRVCVLDYSGPNIAKNMHVGHIRSTIIGDCLARVHEALGHRVVRQNHLGDWGTQFGMLIEHLVESGDPVRTAQSAVGDLDALYRSARERFDSDEDFANRARQRVVDLQAGDAQARQLWDILVSTSKTYFRAVYDRLGVTLTDADDRGESFYNDMLDAVVENLESKGLLRISDGALCAFPDGFVGRDGEAFPLIVRKSDGGYGYVATDLATIRYSVDHFGGNELVYVTDARQAQHFHMVFAVARQAGWIDEAVSTVHVGYGMVLGTDNKPFKTRSGKTIQLSELLDEAVSRAQQAMSERSSDLSEDEQLRTASAVGIGAIKWFDLKNEHTNNYVFDFDRMLAFNGNTGPYVQYASTRAKSIIRKANQEPAHAQIQITEDAERALVLQLPLFGSAVNQVLESLEPHHLCSYLYELAERFSSFYETCPILNVEDEQLRASRLALCVLTSRVLDRGLNLLGINSVERM